MISDIQKGCGIFWEDLKKSPSLRLDAITFISSVMAIIGSIIAVGYSGQFLLPNMMQNPGEFIFVIGYGVLACIGIMKICPIIENIYKKIHPS